MANVGALNIELYRGDDSVIGIPLGGNYDNATVTIAPYLSDEIIQLPNNCVAISGGVVSLTFNADFTENAEWRVAEYEIRTTQNGKSTTLYEGEIRIAERDLALNNNTDNSNVGGQINSAGNINNADNAMIDWGIVTQSEADEDFYSIN